MNFEIKYIKDLTKILTDNGLSEITIENLKAGSNITIKKEAVCKEIAAPQVITEDKQENIEIAKEENTQPKGVPITSPMVGTFYAAPSPKLPPFVQEGDTIKKGQVICIIEAMKLMNEIESDIAGKVTKICLKNGDAVEFGQVLMYIE